MPQTSEVLTAEIKKFCKNFTKKKANDFERYLSESWFSNTLAWLLNPKESHGLGVAFANEFLKKIAQKRSLGFYQPGSDHQEHSYLHRASLLKWHKNKHSGKSSLNFSLGNAYPVREFYLTRDEKAKKYSLPSFVDLLLMDLDIHDGLVVAAENKLFTTNHKQQLEYYHESIERKFQLNTVVREYVYLTLRGDAPLDVELGERKKWVCLSWLEDIKEILETPEIKKIANADLKKLVAVLNWLSECSQMQKNLDDKHIKGFKNAIRNAATECLLEELNRISTNRTSTAKWSVKEPDHWELRHTLVHSSNPKRSLTIDLLPNLTMTVRGDGSRKELFEKVIVPFGCNSGQLYNLIDLSAKDIYRQYFHNKDLYKVKMRRRTTLSDEKLKHKALFTFVSEYATALQLLLTFSSLCAGKTQSDTKRKQAAKTQSS